MNAEERFVAALEEYSKAYRDYVMSSNNLTISEILSDGYVGNISFNIKGKEYELAVSDSDYVCIHSSNMTDTIGRYFSKSDCEKLKNLVVATLGEVDKQKRIKELEKKLKELKGK